jgi:hypothetical protein
MKMLNVWKKIAFCKEKRQKFVKVEIFCRFIFTLKGFCSIASCLCALGSYNIDKKF